MKHLRFQLDGGVKSNVFLNEAPAYTVSVLRDYLEQIPGLCFGRFLFKINRHFLGTLFGAGGMEIVELLKDADFSVVFKRVKEYVCSLPRANEQSIKLLSWAFMHLASGEEKYDEGWRFLDFFLFFFFNCFLGQLKSLLSSCFGQYASVIQFLSSNFLPVWPEVPEDKDKLEGGENSNAKEKKEEGHSANIEEGQSEMKEDGHSEKKAEKKEEGYSEKEEGHSEKKAEKKVERHSEKEEGHSEKREERHLEKKGKKETRKKSGEKKGEGKIKESCSQGEAENKGEDKEVK